MVKATVIIRKQTEESRVKSTRRDLNNMGCDMDVTETPSLELPVRSLMTTRH